MRIRDLILEILSVKHISSTTMVGVNLRERTEYIGRGTKITNDYRESTGEETSL